MIHFLVFSVPTGIIYYGTPFVVLYNGTVTGVSIMTPGASSHGTEQTQRMLFPTFTQSAGQLTITAPPDATILLQGYHMLFLLNGDTPSEAKWIRLGDAPQPTVRSTSAPTVTVSEVPVIPPTQAPTENMYDRWVELVGYSYDPLPNNYPSLSTIANYTVPASSNCKVKCESDPGCDFYTFNSKSKICDLKYTDKLANTSTVFKGQQSGELFGQLQYVNVISTSNTTSVTACINLCSASAQCQFVSYDYTNALVVICTLNFFNADSATTIGYRQNPRPLNYNPPTLGRVDVIGNSGIVCETANLLPNGQVLCSAQPEFTRVGKNWDNFIEQPFPDPNALAGFHEVHDGELASVFDPLTGLHVASPVDQNVGGQGAILAEDGTIFAVGGDDRTAPSGFTTGPTGGLLDGLIRQRTFDFRTSSWSYLSQPLATTRWIPSILRLVNGSFMIIGGMSTETSWAPRMTIEINYSPTANNTLTYSPLLASTGTTAYPKAAIIPGSGNIFLFSQNNYAILSKDTGLTLSMPTWWSPDNGVTWLPPVGPSGRRSGNYVAGNCLLPIRASTGYVTEFALFGGSNSLDTNQTAQDNVARITITDAQPVWTYDSDKMPYGRVGSDCTLQPNGKILITNGARLGIYGGYIAASTMFAPANGNYYNEYCIQYPENLIQIIHPDIFLYDPEAVPGSKFTVLANSNIRRLYHSTSLFVPDGRTLLMGTDQATNDPATAFEHRVEAYTPPWLLNGTPRPIIVRYEKHLF